MRISPQPIEVQYDGQWRAGVLRSWEVDAAGLATGVVTFNNARGELEVGRFVVSDLRYPAQPSPRR